MFWIKVAVRVIDGAMVVIFGLIVLSLAGVHQYSLFGGITLTIHRISLPFTYIMLLALARMFLTSPRGLTPGQMIDHWIDKVRHALQGCATGSGAAGKRCARLFSWIGIDASASEIRISGLRATFWIFVGLTAWLMFSPIYRYGHYGVIPDIGIFFESLLDALNGGAFTNPFHLQMAEGLEAFAESPETRQSNFAHHFQPLLYLLLPVFAVAQSPVTLFVCQALVVAAGVFPCFLLARDVLKREEQALAVTLCYALYPSVLSTAWSFYPDAFAVTALMWAFWFARSGRTAFMLIFLALTLSAKETMALPVLSFGAYLFLWERRQVLGLGVAAAAVAYLFVSLHLIIPFFANAADYPYVKGLYGPLGGSLAELLRTLLLQPWKILPYLFSWSALKYFLGLLFPVAFLPLLGWRIWILTLPVLLQNLLVWGPQGDMWNRSSTGLWSATLIPFTFVAVLQALKILGEHTSQVALRRVLAVLMITTLLSISLASPPYRWSLPAYGGIEKTVRNQIPAGASVSTNVRALWCQLTKDYTLYLFPKRYDATDYVVIEINPAQSGKVPDAGPLVWEYQEAAYGQKIEARGDYKRITEMPSPRRGYMIRLYQKIPEAPGVSEAEDQKPVFH